MKTISKQRKQILEQSKKKALQKPKTAAPANPSLPFYHDPNYLDNNKLYMVLKLSGIELNIVRTALLHYFRSNQDQSLWENMERFSELKRKIDDARVMKTQAAVTKDPESSPEEE